MNKKQYNFQINSKHGIFTVIIDEEDKDKILKHNWSISKNGNYVRIETRINKKLIRLHRFILNLCKGDPEVDHKNRNTLDNRKDNLRVATREQNMRNVKFKKKNKHGYIGVYKWKEYFRGCISVNNKTIHVPKYFKTAKDAALARDELAYKISGEFAILNFPKQMKDR